MTSIQSSGPRPSGPQPPPPPSTSTTPAIGTTAPASTAGPARPATAPAAKTDTFQSGPAEAKLFGAAAPATASAPSATDIQKARDAAGLKSTAPKLPPELHDPARVSVSTADIKGYERMTGQPLSVKDLAVAFPNAKINVKGAPLTEINRKPTGQVGADGMPVTLGAATIDKNGDLDVSNLYRKEISQNNQNLLMKKGDEFPVPLQHTIKNSVLQVAEESQKKALSSAGFPSKDGALQIDMRDMSQVKKALEAVGVSPANPGQIDKELKQQGVTVPMSSDDQLRRVLVGKLDSPKNVLDIDDKVVEHAGNHNQDIQPTVYASAKVSPENLDSVILAYKRFNNQSYAGQGNWVTEVLGKDKASQHEFDAEATFVKINTTSHQLEQVMAARHYFGEVYSKKDVDDLKKRTGRDDLTTSVSYLAHGGRLAENTEQNKWAGHGDDGVKFYDPRDHILKDKFMGLKDAQSGAAVLIPKEKVNLVVESDDQQSLNLKTHFGETRTGILGTKVMDIYNDGMPPDRFFGTDWYYQHEKLATQKDKVERAVDTVVDTVKDAGRAIGRGAEHAVDAVKTAGRATVQGFHVAKAKVSGFLKKLVDW